MKPSRTWFDHLSAKNQTLQNTGKTVVLATLALTLLTVLPLYYLSLGYFPSFLWCRSSRSTSTSLSRRHGGIQQSTGLASSKQCDLFTGEWVPNPDAPSYTNSTCFTIHDEQNCMKFGRPDTEYMKWRWKPDGCELPVFNPLQFFELVRGKSMAFVGDSIGRNQMESLMCLLSSVEQPVEYQTLRWRYPTYNFTIANVWAPFIVKSKAADPDGPVYTALFNLYLDEFDDDWIKVVVDFDYVILAAEHWFFRPTMFYEKGQLVGCYLCRQENVTDLSSAYSYSKAYRTAFRALNSLQGFKGITFLRTFSPQHFENGFWNEGGRCVRTRPYKSSETRLEGLPLEMYLAQTDEFKVAEREGRKRGLKFRLLDITFASLLRPDAHPNNYGHWPRENVTFYNDCSHWCLPGAIDTWNDLLLQRMKMEAGRSFDGS